MSGYVCCMVDCHTCQQKTAVHFMHLPKPSTDKEKELWRKTLIHQIGRTDNLFNPANARICSRHFHTEDLKPHGRGMTLRQGALPRKWLPVKSVQVPTVAPRKEPTPRPPPIVPDRVHYFTLREVEKDAKEVEHPWLRLHSEAPNTICFGVLEGQSLKFKVVVEENLWGNITVNGSASLKMTFEKHHINHSLNTILKIHLCSGITEAPLQSLAPLPSPGTRFHRIISNTQTPSGPIATSIVQARNCTTVTSSTGMCAPCKKIYLELQAKLCNRQTSLLRPIKKTTPLSTQCAEKLANEVKILRKSQNALQAKVDELQISINKHVVLEEELHLKLKHSIDTKTIEDPLAKLFWEQQKKAFSTSAKGMRWHPMMIRLAIMLHSQSPGAYKSLKESGVLKLPGESTLRDYTNYFHPTEGFNFHVLEQLRKAAEGFQNHQRFVVLLHDEMTIQTDLVYDRRSGEIVGFMKPHSWETNGSTLATHVLCFMVVGVNTNLKMTVGFFGTRTATAADLMPLMWEAIGYLESFCGLKVIASTSDKGSANQRLYRLHGEPGEAGVCYKTLNIYAPERYLYFFSDAPHLVKTVRNNIASSGWGKNTKRLWNDGQEILWQHIVQLYNRDSRELRRTRLTTGHIHLTPFSCMSVKLAAQVLSERMANLIRDYGDANCQETGRFIRLMDKFFDCLNARSCDEHRKKYREKYDSVDDHRFTVTVVCAHEKILPTLMFAPLLFLNVKFLEQEFLPYLARWETSVKERPGRFTKGERSKMFLTYQTHEGLQMTAHSFIEATKFLLQNGVGYVLSACFNQDPLEEHFGRHRGLGRRSTNPTLWTFGYQEQKLRLQRTLALQIRPRGNVAGQRRKAVVSDSPLKKLRR